MYLFIFFCILSFLFLIMTYKYMLILLMMVELIILLISVIMFLVMGAMKIEFYMIYYLVFSICEGVLGLSLLVLIIRYYGNEFYYFFNLSKF